MARYEPTAPPPKYDQDEDQQQQQQHWVTQQQPTASGMDPYRVGYNQPSVNMDRSGGSGGGTHVMVNLGNVVTNQPRQLRTWSTSLCGCCEDMSSCCLVTWCTPCFLCCSLSPRMGESCCAPFCLSLCGHSAPLVYRTKLRAAHGISGGAIDDCCVTSSCSLPCALCQMKRELDYIERSTGQLAFQRV
ncbi:hypothetical protein BOX15_Mlig013282g1 [Macrostomum lignano]|uniref:Placenta-specific gene 8 protein n=1 Tax=Macrostomum lignano TaxID=282301 RepID=A0A267E7Q7_9PLAT|nr:hypothetical protein BOX15_Mlig013282g1 [Macrostomum lignano]